MNRKLMYTYLASPIAIYYDYDISPFIHVVRYTKNSIPKHYILNRHHSFIYQMLRCLYIHNFPYMLSLEYSIKKIRSKSYLGNKTFLDFCCTWLLTQHTHPFRQKDYRIFHANHTISCLHILNAYVSCQGNTRIERRVEFVFPPSKSSEN